MKADGALRAQIDRYTVICTKGSAPPRRVLVLPPGTNLVDGLEAGRRLADEGSLRIVGHGVTMSAVRPAWASQAEGLWLTELGAYKFRAGIAGTTALREGLRSWTNDLLGHLGEIEAARALWQSAASRFFQEKFDGHLVAEGIALAHRDEEILVHGATSSTPHLARRSRLRTLAERALWPALLASSTTAALLATLAHASRDYVRAKPSRAWLRGHPHRASQNSPKVWIGVVPDFPRINTHVVESFFQPLSAQRRDVGVILVGSLTPGARSETDFRDSLRTESLWGGLGALAPHLDEMIVRQCVGAENVRQLLSDLVVSTATTMRATARLAVRGPFVDCGTERFSLFGDVANVARFLTIDVARAVAATNATKRFLRRHDVQGRSFVMSASSAAAIAGVDARLQDAGATTIELFHGTGGDYWHGAAESASTYRCVWTQMDATLHDGARHQVILGGMPRARTRARRKSSRREWNILLITNNVHRDHRPIRFPMRPYQQELLRAVEAIAHGDPSARFRWRPHPSDVDDVLEADSKLCPSVDRSRGRPLADDLEWADVVVSTQSSALAEALVGGLPVIGYIYPETLMAATYLHPSRVFFRSEDLAERLALCLRDAQSSNGVVAPAEHYALERLFGPSETPAAFPFERIAGRELTPLFEAASTPHGV